ncbi:hypothetical protein [Methylorubrum thiocyanatum]|uniref:VapC45 PIN like domain-containing protein n=1 Tax=Methylorubrum thiocyanatum TaxID=47958 RepID=A0AA40RZG1_9HYPH|nr:hypothetical protein [Methylorubrum thiocyanatum]MBA8911770.1 hypothetical protein [Methylorubrum thiocyanatum]
MPRPLRHALAGHEVSYVEKEGWKGKENGELLALVEGRFDFILTSDGNIAYQQTLAGRALSMIVVPTNNLTHLRANGVAILQTLDEIAALDHRVIVTLDWRGRRSLRRLDAAGATAVELGPVRSFRG